MRRARPPIHVRRGRDDDEERGRYASGREGERGFPSGLAGVSALTELQHLRGSAGSQREGRHGEENPRVVLTERRDEEEADRVRNVAERRDRDERAGVLLFEDETARVGPRGEIVRGLRVRGEDELHVVRVAAPRRIPVDRE